MEKFLTLTLSFEGSNADNHAIDLYDVSSALLGFERTLALTTHLILNQEVITQAPSLKNAQIMSFPSKEGSWKMTVGVILTGAYALGTLSNDSPLGHLVFSAYDYVISESLGVHVDYNKSLGVLYEESKNKDLPKIEEYQLDSIRDKCINSIKEMHRPIFKSNTADKLKIFATLDEKELPLSTDFTHSTYAYLKEDIKGKEITDVECVVSSYNINTKKGRVSVKLLGRTVPFELHKSIENDKKILEILLRNFQRNGLREKNEEIENIKITVLPILSINNHLKQYVVYNISDINSSN
ncbi:MAG: hypothetical protein ABXS91_09095 [Sulfurimonas sp.]